MKDMKDMKHKAEQFAIKVHNDVNQKYDGKSYDVHLRMVAEVGKQFINLIPEEERDFVIAG